MNQGIKKILEKFNIITYEPLLKGWSRDKKYILTSSDYKKYILRITDSSFHKERLRQYNILKDISKYDLHTTKAVDFGILDGGSVYMLMTYLEGEEGIKYVNDIDDDTAYKLGLEAGEILRMLHNIPVDSSNYDWWRKYQEKLPNKIYNIRNCGRKVKMQEKIIKYYEDNLYLMKDRPLLFSHGDYHLGNMIINNGEVGIIDFEKSTIADPYDDLKPFRWNVLANEYFETGLINAYFEFNIPDDFFPILKFYAAESMISQLPWALNYGEEEIKTAYMLVDKQLEWYDNLKLDIPTWYKGIL